MSEETKTQSIEQKPGNSTPEGKGGQGAKTFTQDEVNRIVSERLARERDKSAVEQAKTDSIEQREKDLSAREAAMSCREYIAGKGYPDSLLEVFDTTDADKFKAQVDKLIELFPEIDPTKAAKMPVFVRGGTGGSYSGNSQIADAFKPKRR